MESEVSQQWAHQVPRQSGGGVLEGDGGVLGGAVAQESGHVAWVLQTHHQDAQLQPLLGRRMVEGSESLKSDKG